MYQNIFITSWSENSPSMVYLWDDVEGLSVTPFDQDYKYAYKLDPKGTHRSMHGERLKKVRRFQRDDMGLYESDLSRETRVLTDRYLNEDDPSTGHKILCLDIEVDSEGGFAKAEVADKEITAIGCYSYSDDRYVMFLLDKHNRMPSYEENNRTILSFKTEVELLTAFLEYYDALAPTIMTGWNIDSYDIPYIINRLNRVMGRNSSQLLSPVGLIKFQEQRMRYQIAGVSCIDYLPLYKKFTYSQRPSYRLDAIGLVEINLGKVEYDGTLDQLYASDIHKFIDYNFRDLEIVVGLDKKMKLIELARFICHIGHVPYEDYAYSSKFIEGTIITYLHRKGIIASNKPAGGREAFQQKMDDDSEGFTGAFVKHPFPGVYPWVYSLDLQSLYPSIIMSLNISPETKCGQVMEWDTQKHMKGTMDYRVVMADESRHTFTKDEFDAWMKKWGYNISSNGILYSTNRTGIIPEILDKWFKERVEYKNTMKKYVKEGNAELADFYDRRQHVQKILLNSIYGVLGLSIFRFYDLDNALAVTATGQDIIKTTAKFINSKYKTRGVSPKTDAWANEYVSILKKHKVSDVDVDLNDHCVYIDTDSVYFSAKDLMDIEPNPPATVDDQKLYTITVAREMEKAVNSFYDVLAYRLFYCTQHRLVIKGESVIQKGLWVAKKRYAMKKVFDLETDKAMDKLAVKGLDTVRSSFPPAFSKLMSQVLTMILDGEPQSEIDTIILDFRKKLPEMDYVSIARNTSIKKISVNDDPTANSLDRFPKGATAHQKASIAYNRVLRSMGLDKKFPLITDGDKIKWVYLISNAYGLDTIAFKGYDDPEVVLKLVEEYIDYDTLFEKELANKLEDFYEALRWGSLPTKVNQNYSEFFTLE
jgi:DNA polymerase elongation subunit (family B)